MAAWRGLLGRVTGGRRGWARWALILILVSGCAALEEDGEPPAAPDITNPVYAEDFPDPFVLEVDGTYYAYATNANDARVQTIRSTNLTDWEWVGDAMPDLPAWAPDYGSYTWAPSVLPRDDGYVMYVTTRLEDVGRQCISRSVSDDPAGPFVDELDELFVCQLDLGGSIDATPFVDVDGTPYLIWKNDGNCCGYLVAIWVQELSDDGLSLVGEPAELIRYDQVWEYPVVEGPAMVLDEGRYYLFYSADRWDTHRYAIGYAVCESAMGTCEKPLEEPLLSGQGEVAGPGGQEFFRDELGRLWMAYHAWTAGNVGYPEGARSLHLARVEFEGGVPVIEGAATGE